MKVLLAFDGSGYSVRAAQYLIKMSEENPAVNVTVITVAELGEDLVNLLPPGKVLAEIKESCFDRAREIAAMAVSMFRDARLEVNSVVKLGEPSRTITGYAARENFDLIVMGKHGLNDFKGILIGSVTRQVISLSPCPVMVVQ
ncbi:MAG: universal stress protein [Firmicutes bacterium]|nr:universal stress protein [Bacillota bacterium]